MKTIHAVFENGVFRPTEPVDLPEGSEVTVEPMVTGATTSVPSDKDELGQVYEVLSRRHRSGFRDTAERHNEHQP